jgi:hypothetical protein
MLVKSMVKGAIRGSKRRISAFFASVSNLTKHLIILWRPLFIIVLFIIVLWRELNCVKIPQGEVNKSANRWGNLRAKGGVVVPPSVYT